MNLNKVIRSIFRDWPIKIISLLLAVGIYLVVNYVVLDTRYVEIPLEVIIPPGYEVMSKVPTSVTLKIVGDERYIQLVDPSAINAKADFTFATKGGTLSVPVLLEAQESYIDLNFTLSTAPEIIRLYLATVDVGVE
ncbi:MAG: hypothetical protein ACOXZ2_01960 [Sphaerochaetaceae bacterium]|jgi:YbbR domain-containing protein|nr:hypothetical protein [Sphaerochaetaceae bacterium]HHU88443.1 hypothetical protein [Spirochaetales bacterium]